MLNSAILGSGHYVPSKVVTNDDLAKLFPTSDEWIQQRSGIKERRFIEHDGIGASDLALPAARMALEQAGKTERDLDALIFATLSPDFNFPGSGVLLQHKLGIAGVPALDVRNQCSGFLFSLSIADAWIRSGIYRHVLVVGAEVHSTGLEFSERGREVTVLFGDGAGAVLVGAVDTGAERPRGVLTVILHGDGSGAQDLWVEAPASARAGLTIADIDLFIPHQANMRINQHVAKELGIPENKVVHNIERYGNTTAATIPIGISEAQRDGRIPAGSTVLLAAFGAGFTWGAAIVRF